MVEYSKYYNYYLDSAEFTIVTDNTGVKGLFDKKDSVKGRQARWVLEFQELYKRIRYRPGDQNVVADYFTRLPPENPVVGAVTVQHFLQPSNEELLQAQERDDVLQQAVRVIDESEVQFFRGTFLRGPDGIYRLNGKIIVPTSMQAPLVKRWHTCPSLGHTGKNKLYGLMSQHFFWPKMKRTVSEVIKTCEVCQKLKGNPNVTPLPPNWG